MRCWWFSFGLSVGYRMVNLRWPLAILLPNLDLFHLLTYFNLFYLFTEFCWIWQVWKSVLEGLEKNDWKRWRLCEEGSWSTVTIAFWGKLQSLVGCFFHATQMIASGDLQTSTTRSWFIVCSLCPDCQPKQSGWVHSEEEYFAVHSG